MTDSVRLTPGELEVLLARAAEAGAKRVLIDLGLDGPDAGMDVRDLLRLLWAWRDAKKTIRRALWQTITRTCLVAFLTGLALHLWGPIR